MTQDPIAPRIGPVMTGPIRGTVPVGAPPLLIVGHGTRSAAGIAEFTRFVERAGSCAGGRIPAVAGGVLRPGPPARAHAGPPPAPAGGPPAGAGAVVP